MKMTKIALLASAALVAVSMGARADDLSDLKARIAALEANAATTSVPAGFALMSVGSADAIVVPGLDIDSSYSKKAMQIGIVPTADMPASTAIQWSGFVRAALIFTNDKDTFTGRNAAGAVVLANSGSSDFSTTRIKSRGEIKVVGTTDTAVGEVGALMKLRASWSGSAGGSVSSPEAWGWWKLSPDLTLGGGYTGTLANIGYGYDGACNCYYTDNAPVGLNPGDTTQMRLTYASGPISMAVALEDRNAGLQALGGAAELKYSGDTINGEVSGGYWAKGSQVSDAYRIGAGIGMSLGDMAKVSLAAGTGRNFAGFDSWSASALVSASLSESVSAEVAYGYSDADSFDTGFPGPNYLVNSKTNAVLGGVYYTPVSQLTIGLEGEWYRTNEKSNGASTPVGFTIDDTFTHFSADLVTVFRF